MNQPNLQSTEAILAEMATIKTMERGKLSKEYRDGAPNEAGVCAQLGPYYKLQAWDKGRNSTRRVPTSEVANVQEDLANHRRFTELADSFVEQTIARTRVLRRSGTDSAESAEAKKNSTSKRRRKNTKKPKPSSPKPKRA